MKNAWYCLLILPLLALTSFKNDDPKADEVFCDGLKKITACFNNKAFDQLKGKAIGDTSDANDRQYLSLLNLQGYISQVVYETDQSISFAAVLHKDFETESLMLQHLEQLSKQLSTCIGVQAEYSETRSFIHYSFLLNDGVVLELTGNYPKEKRRYINIEVAYKK